MHGVGQDIHPGNDPPSQTDVGFDVEVAMLENWQRFQRHDIEKDPLVSGYLHVPIDPNKAA
jgi:hypothetical protein